MLSLLLLFSWSESTPAQTPISLGVKGGLNLANASATQLPAGFELSSRTAIGFGGIVEIGLSDPIYLQTEPRYIQKGADLKFTFTAFGETFTGSGTGRFNYVEIPVSLKAKFDAGTVTPYLFAGPTLSFLLSAEREFESQGQKETINIKDEIESTEFSLDFGGGIAYPIAPKMSLTMDVRYTLGLTNIAKLREPNDKITWKSRDVKLLVGALFSL